MNRPPMFFRIMTLAAPLAWIGLIAWANGGAPADDAFDRAKHLLHQDAFDQAITQLDEALRLAPNQAKYVGLRGEARLRKGEYAKGAADLQAAINLNPGDLGAVYQPSTEAKLSDQSLQHGQRQVADMLRDRPAMAQFGSKADFLRRWAVRKFAGEDFSSPIDWDPSPPLHSDAEHLAPEDGDHAAILVAANYDEGPNAGKPRSFEELWAGAVYELHNVNYAREFIRLNDEAKAGKISKQDFVAGILKYELRAAQQTRAFYVRVLLPWIERQKLPTDPTLWFCDWWDTPESVLQSFTDPSAYPWRPYARTHDWATVHHYWRQEDFPKTIKLLEQMRDEEGYEDEQEDVVDWINRCGEQIEKKHHGDTEGTEKNKKN